LDSNTHLYNAEISAGSLLPGESREISKLLIEGADDEVWHQALVVDNVLQKKSPSSARRMARLIRNRLEAMDVDHWHLILDSSREIVLQALLAAAIKHSKLLEDFMVEVVKEHYHTFKRELSKGDWTAFLEDCESRDSAAASWSDSTKKKLGQVVIRILLESGYLNNSRNMRLYPIQIHPKVSDYLKKRKMQNILRCMEIDR